ncbi:hypothetical protein Tco_0076668, partial [Tanacetum coccineum]
MRNVTLKKNQEVNLHYIKHLKENVETLREIVEEAKVKRPLDTSLASTCRYTKHSQELLEYVIATCPTDFSPCDKQNVSTSSLRKKRVTFVEPCETSTHNTPPQVEHQKINLTNAPGIPSTGVKDPPPPPPSPTTNRGDQSQSSAAPGSSKTTASTEYTAWTTTTSRLKLAASSIPKDVLMHEESDFEAHDMGSEDEDSDSRHIPKVSLNQEWFKPLSEEERPATPEPAWSIPSSSLPVPNNNWASDLASSFVPPPENSLLSQTSDIGVFIDWFCKKQGITELILEHLEGPAYEVVKAFHPDV